MNFDIWATRSSSGYSGTGARKPSGYEHHVVTGGRRPGVEAEVLFTNYGRQHYRVTAAGGASPISQYATDDGVAISLAMRRGLWSGDAIDGDERHTVALTVDTDARPVPSFVARWLPLLLPSKSVEDYVFVPLPEDGFGGWQLTRKQWFPVMNVIKAEVHRFVREGDQVNTVTNAGDVVAVLTLEGGMPRRYEQRGCVLDVVDEARARRLG